MDRLINMLVSFFLHCGNQKCHVARKKDDYHFFPLHVGDMTKCSNITSIFFKYLLYYKKNKGL